MDQLKKYIETYSETSTPKKDAEDLECKSSPKKRIKAKGLSLPLAAVFIAGEMAGSGVLALPKAIADAGWAGIAMLLICGLNCLYSGICLGRCWMILEERYEEYRARNRHPYPAIAYRAVGIKMSYLVSFCNNFTLIGASTVFLLLSAQIIKSLAGSFGISFCYWILILALVLCPLMWLGTPDDFWPCAILALSTTGMACILLLIGIGKEGFILAQASYPPPEILSFFLSFATILFAFGGASSFPTFQNDMRDKSEFSKAATIGFSILLTLYMPVSILGYIVYGGDVKTNIMLSMQESALKIIINVLFALHMLFAFLIIINTPAQELEQHLNIPRSFGWKRILLRTTLIAVVVFVAQTIPRFGKVLNLVGASTIALTTAVFPCYFYLRLCSQEAAEWPKRNIPWYEKTYAFAVMVTSAVGGCVASYAAVKDILYGKTFSPPCYVNFTAASAE